ncbi:hypothetical protein EMCRGX_G008786 [Ephydatia muelleri]
MAFNTLHPSTALMVRERSNIGQSVSLSNSSPILMNEGSNICIIKLSIQQTTCDSAESTPHRGHPVEHKLLCALAERTVPQYHSLYSVVTLSRVAHVEKAAGHYEVCYDLASRMNISCIVFSVIQLFVISEVCHERPEVIRILDTCELL